MVESTACVKKFGRAAHAAGPGRGERDECRALGGVSGEFVPVVNLELVYERLQVTVDSKTFAKPCPIDQWEARFLQQWPALSEKWAVGFDENGLDRRARHLCGTAASPNE